MRARVPGGSRPWFHVLPEEYHNNPNIVAVVVPRGSTTRIGSAPDGFKVGILETKQGVRALQIIGAGGTYVDHQTIIEDQYGLRMAEYKYAGALSRLPDSYLLDERFPLLFLRDRMGEPYLNLKNYIWAISKGDDDHDTN